MIDWHSARAKASPAAPRQESRRAGEESRGQGMPFQLDPESAVSRPRRKGTRARMDKRKPPFACAVRTGQYLKKAETQTIL